MVESRPEVQATKAVATLANDQTTATQVGSTLPLLFSLEAQGYSIVSKDDKELVRMRRGSMPQHSVEETTLVSLPFARVIGSNRLTLNYDMPSLCTIES
jgi:hypothetical protein